MRSLTKAVTLAACMFASAATAFAAPVTIKFSHVVAENTPQRSDGS
ncbi:hypothetical protein SAMN06264348_104266 [Oceanospirillum linum]|nr:C4-dicarboxylate-binding protein DctP [Oleiphilus messinensis]SMP22652.1 hypothetical protein SAMN06264348_104266 [Oceanospirillum linum]